MEEGCPQFLRSTWPTMDSDNEDLAFNDMTSLITAVKTKRVLPVPYAAQVFHHVASRPSRNPRQSYGRRTPQSTTSSRTTSTLALRGLGDTDDTEDEGVFHFQRCRSASISSYGSCDCLRRQAASLGSLTSSQSSLGERSTNTVSPLFEDGYPFMRRTASSTSLQAILDSDACPEYGRSLFSHDQKMRDVVQEIVSPKAVRKTRTNPVEGPRSYHPQGPSQMLHEVQKNRVLRSTPNLTAVDPSILAFVPRSRPVSSAKIAESTPEKYSPTSLCDLSKILSCPVVPASIETVSRPDLALLRAGTSPVNEDTVDQLPRPGWDIPSDDKKADEHLTCVTRIRYRRLSESSDSSADALLEGQDLRLLEGYCSSLSSDSLSISTSSSGVHDLSDYLADVSSEEGATRHVFVWPPRQELTLHLEGAGEPFVLFPRIPGVAYYGAPSDTSLEKPGHVSQGIGAFFSSRSIMHRLGPHGMERVYDEESCPEHCGFAFPVPPRGQMAP